MAAQTSTQLASRLRRLWGSLRGNGRDAPVDQPPDPTLWERIAAIGDRIPDEDIAQLPKDGARNFDHYVDGVPKQD